MPCNKCGKVKCDHSLEERGQTLIEVMAEVTSYDQRLLIGSNDMDERIAEKKLLRQDYADRDLRLFPGEEWLPTEPEVMTWYEAVRRVQNDPTLRLPHYSDLIWVEQMVKQKPELQSKFKPLERGQFWSCVSERYNSNSEFACWVTFDHEHYESHISKKVAVNVRFIRKKTT